jgi:hypothetical protein
MAVESIIETHRLELHHISAEGLIQLFEEKSDVLAIAGRDFVNPYKVLVLLLGECHR